MSEARTGLDEFRDFVRDFQSLPALAAKAALAAPLIDLATDMGPPWPAGMPVATSLSQVVVLLLLFQFWHSMGQARLRRRLAVASGAVLGSFFFYLLLVGLLVVEIPGGSRDVAGFVVRPEVRPLLAPDFSALDALAGAEYDSGRVWTAGSIMAARLTLVASWLVFFSGITAVFATFALGQRRRRVRSAAAPAG